MVLVGMMGTGKSTVGQRLAELLERPFVDSDEQVEASTGRTVREIFEAEGEAAFRRCEAKALAEAVGRSTPSVLAAAGGVVLDPANRALLAGAGTVVWLTARPEVLAERVKGGEHRPLLADDPLGVLRRLSREREVLYREVADHVIDVATVDAEAVAHQIAELVGS